MIIGSVSSLRYLGGRQFGESLFLDRHICMQVHLDGFDRLMTEPKSNHGAVNAMVEQFHGQRVAQYMGRDPLFRESWTLLPRLGDMFVDDVRHSVLAEPSASGVWKQRIAGTTGSFTDPTIESSDGFLTQRCSSFFPSFAATTHVGSSAQSDVFRAQTSQF